MVLVFQTSEVGSIPTGRSNTASETLTVKPCLVSIGNGVRIPTEAPIIEDQMAKEKKEAPREIPGIFKDVLRSMGFGPIVDRKKNLDKREKKAGSQ